jgi:hypothetical protein
MDNSNLKAMAAQVDAINSAINKLQNKGRASRAGQIAKLKIIRSVYTSIESARNRGVGWVHIVKSLRENGIPISRPTLTKSMSQIKAENDDEARKIAQNIIAAKRRKSE